MSISTNQDSGSQIFGSPVTNVNSMHFNVAKFYEGSTFGSIKSDSTTRFSQSRANKEKCQKYLKSFEQARLLVRHISPPPRLYSESNEQFNPLETQQSMVKTEIKISSIESSIPLVKVGSCAVNSEAFSSTKFQEYQAVNNFETEPVYFVRRHDPNIWNQIEFQKEKKFQNQSIKVYDSITLSGKRNSFEKLKSLIQRSIQTSPPQVKNVSFTKETRNQNTQCDPDKNTKLIALRDATIMLLIIILTSHIIQIIFQYLF